MGSKAIFLVKVATFGLDIGLLSSSKPDWSYNPMFGTSLSHPSVDVHWWNNQLPGLSPTWFMFWICRILSESSRFQVPDLYNYVYMCNYVYLYPNLYLNPSLSLSLSTCTHHTTHMIPHLQRNRLAAYLCQDLASRVALCGNGRCGSRTRNRRWRSSPRSSSKLGATPSR